MLWLFCMFLSALFGAAVSFIRIKWIWLLTIAAPFLGTFLLIYWQQNITESYQSAPLHLVLYFSLAAPGAAISLIAFGVMEHRWHDKRLNHKKHSGE